LSYTFTTALRHYILEAMLGEQEYDNHEKVSNVYFLTDNLYPQLLMFWTHTNLQNDEVDLSEVYIFIIAHSLHNPR
jgi:hypothetical protein